MSDAGTSSAFLDVCIPAETGVTGGEVGALDTGATPTGTAVGDVRCCGETTDE